MEAKPRQQRPQTESVASDTPPPRPREPRPSPAPAAEAAPQAERQERAAPMEAPATPAERPVAKPEAPAPVPRMTEKPSMPEAAPVAQAVAGVPAFVRAEAKPVVSQPQAGEVVNKPAEVAKKPDMPSSVSTEAPAPVKLKQVETKQSIESPKSTPNESKTVNAEPAAPQPRPVEKAPVVERAVASEAPRESKPTASESTASSGKVDTSTERND